MRNYLFVLAFFQFWSTKVVAQTFNDLGTTFALQNPAYHRDNRFHNSDFIGSDFVANTSVYLQTGSNFNSRLYFLRYQLGLGKWKLGLQAASFGVTGFFNFDAGLTFGRDFFISRQLSVRPALGLYGANGFYQNLPISNPTSFGFKAGIQLNYKNVQLHAAANEFYIGFGAAQNFKLDSLQQIGYQIYYEKNYGFQNLRANINYNYQKYTLMLGAGAQLFTAGLGLQLPKRQEIQLSGNINRNLLSSGSQWSLQLNYRWAFVHRASTMKFTGTPSF